MNKTALCRDLETIIEIQEKIIKAQNKTIKYYEDQYWQLHLNAMELNDVYEKQQKELELVYKDRNKAIRNYNALHQLGKFAADLGVDLTAKLPENQKVKWKDHKFSVDTKVMESGRAQSVIKLIKQSSNGQDFKKNKNRNKKGP